MTIRDLTRAKKPGDVGRLGGSAVGVGFESFFGDYAAADHSHQYVETSENLTLFNGYTTHGGSRIPAVYKVGNWVQFQGVLTGPAVAAGTLVAQVPNYYRKVLSPSLFVLPGRAAGIVVTYFTYELRSDNGLYTYLATPALTWLSIDRLGYIQE